MPWGIAERVGEGLEPARLVDGILDAERRLDMDRLGNVGEADLGDVVLDPVMLGLDGVDIAEEGMDGIGLEPAVAELGALHVMEMEMSVDEGDAGHALVPLPGRIPPVGVTLARAGASVGRRDQR